VPKPELTGAVVLLHSQIGQPLGGLLALGH
jgi:hypothetical protein